MSLTPEQKARKAINDKARRERLKLAKAGTVAPTPAASVAKALTGKAANKKLPSTPKAKAPTGAGRPVVPGGRMVVFAFRCTPDQKNKLAKLGSAWVRERIDRATV